MYQVYVKFGDCDWFPYMRPTKMLWAARVLVSWLKESDSKDGMTDWEYKIVRIV